MKFAKIFLVLFFIFSFYGCATESKEVAKGAVLTTPELTEEQAYRIGVKAYVFGYPLVLMGVTRKTSAQRSGMNNFTHARAFHTAAYRLVVRTNVDTLYSSAWLDLSQEPMVLSLPDTGGRYYVMQMRDGWTETFALLGKRTTGTQVCHFVIIGPDWQGPLPSNVEAIKAPSNMAWITGRIQTNGVADYSNVHAIQQGYRLTRLSAWPRHAPAAPRVPVVPTVDSKLPPPAQVARMDAATFFTAFAALLKEDRARSARFGLGGLPPEEAVYPHTAVDSAGRWLNGTNRYVLQFGKDELPPVRAFWSVTLYDAEGYFWENPLKRYALGDRDKLQYNQDGSLDIYI